MTRVLLIATYSQALSAFIAPFAKFLEKKGYEVTLAASDEELAGPSTFPQLKAEGFRVVVIPFTNRLLPHRDFQAARILRRELKRERFDIVHTYTAKAGFIGRMVARSAGVPLVLHTAFSFPYLDSPEKAWLYLPLERLATRACDHVFSISELGYQQACDLGVRPRAGISNPGIGLDLNRFGPMVDHGAARTELGLPAGVPLIGTAARLVDHKRIDLFLEIAARVASAVENARFAILGKGPLYDDLVNQSERLGLSEKVQFLKYLEHADDVVKYFRALDVFVLPTQREGFGLVFAEAMAQETPVVGPDILPIRDIVADGETGFLVKPESLEEYTEAVTRLALDPDLRRSFGGNGRERVLRHFDQRRSFEMMEQTYRELLSGLAGASLNKPGANGYQRQSIES
jgi:glycosyltransferase involved in cell wall biosynthesis